MLEEETKIQWIREILEFYRMNGCSCDAPLEQDLECCSASELISMYKDLVRETPLNPKAEDVVKLRYLSYKERVQLKIETGAPLRGRVPYNG